MQKFAQKMGGECLEIMKNLPWLHRKIKYDLGLFHDKVL